MTAALIIIGVLALACVVLFLYAKHQLERRKSADDVSRQNVKLAQSHAREVIRLAGELSRLQHLQKKTEAIRDEQTKNHDRAATFDGSINVLSDLSKAGRDRLRSADADNGVDTAGN